MKLKDILTEARRLADIDDEMGRGLPPQEKAFLARERSAKNEHRASERVKQLLDEIYDEAILAYSDVRVHKNFGITSANVKVGHVRHRDRISAKVQALEARLLDEYGIVPRKVAPDSVLYHIPYDIFDQQSGPVHV